MRRTGWLLGRPARLRPRVLRSTSSSSRAFLRATQPRLAEALDLGTRRPDAAKLPRPAPRRDHASAASIDVLRNGVKHGPHHSTSSTARRRRATRRRPSSTRSNRFSVTRQLRYSRDETQLALDLGLFINGLPVATFELKNSLTKQTVDDAVEQYQRDRDPRELLFEFGRCLAHFAVDDAEVRFCTDLEGQGVVVPAVQPGLERRRRQPAEPGRAQDRLPLEADPDAATASPTSSRTTPRSSTRRTRRPARRSATQIFPRYHQLDVVRRLLADAGEHGAGQRYLIQHSAGSGKSNSIAWLAHQLIGLEHDGKQVFDSVIVVTDRRILDKQIRDTIKQFAQVGATVGHAERSGDLREFIEGGKKIIITTVQKFPFILDEHRRRAPRTELRDRHRRGALEPGRQDRRRR